ncbi:hypothetical protein N781_11610 [Pontibacillus halophilus JSM 076056 = DSM 19796]|uniref:Potassium channel domain-containing protein n=1 Tax=Pontibacillus halophilus JSM 076056 = DSM 19796 TaxID=1385510 RepID=A0A0A5G3I7_9BACI|nr:potassium channel family protein [Pontibacillus halophilus]KGX87681.1 hypothetical protein N781_11610 [Pontibacillus halophilus JSM 076056 = DSM 19796]
MGITFMVVIALLLLASLYQWLKPSKCEFRAFSFTHFYTLLTVYLNCMIGFGLMYYILGSEGIVLLEGNLLHEAPAIERLGHAIYFSGVTLMTVGYGDITPIGLGRYLAMGEAMVGYILPASFFVHYIQTSRTDDS